MALCGNDNEKTKEEQFLAPPFSNDSEGGEKTSPGID
jgi:hypothetical protein